jgi:hypothetical protein
VFEVGRTDEVEVDVLLVDDFRVEVLVVESELSDILEVDGEDECTEEYAAASFQVTLPPCEAGNDMMLLSAVKSVKATVLEVLGHVQEAGLLTVSPSSAQAIHSFLSSLYVGWQRTRPAHL